MKLTELKINDECYIVALKVKDEKLKLRLEELGLYRNNKIKMLFISPLKETLLIKIFNSAFALKSNIAKDIIVEKF